MTTLSPQDIMLAVALVVGIAIACQALAPLLRMPALILLLPAGFILGLVAPQFRMDQILGPAFPVAVDLMVAIILFQGGLELGTLTLRGDDRRVVHRLLWIGAPITGVAGALGSHFLLGLPWPLAILLGAILIVSGPTVVSPILELARPNRRVRGILMWESTMLDPIGGIVAVVIFQVVQASDAETPWQAVTAFITSVIVAVVVAIAGLVVLLLGTKLTRGNSILGTQVLIGMVIAASAFANFVADDSGLLTALIMGVAAHPLARRLNTNLDPVLPFFNTLAAFGLGVLFVSIAALAPADLVGEIAIPALVMSVLFIVAVRPLVALGCTFKAGLRHQERILIGWMDPRGIVAAATASSVGAALVAAKVEGAELLLPAAFVIIAVTVSVYGLTAAPAARLLGVREESTAEAPGDPAARN